MWFFFHDWVDLIYCLRKSAKTEREYWYHIYCQRNEISWTKIPWKKNIFRKFQQNMEQSHGKLIKFYRKNKKKVSFHDIPNESKFIMKSGCLSKQKKNTFRYILLQFHWNALFYFRSCPSWYKLWISKNFVLSWDKRVEKMYNESDKKMFMISLSVTLNYFFRSWLLSFRLPNFIGCAIGKTENGSQQIHVSKLTGVRLCDDSIEYGNIE